MVGRCFGVLLLGVCCCVLLGVRFDLRSPIPTSLAADAYEREAAAAPVLADGVPLWRPCRRAGRGYGVTQAMFTAVGSGLVRAH